MPSEEEKKIITEYSRRYHNSKYNVEFRRHSREVGILVKSIPSKVNQLNIEGVLSYIDEIEKHLREMQFLRQHLTDSIDFDFKMYLETTPEDERSEAVIRYFKLMIDDSEEP